MKKTVDLKVKHALTMAYGIDGAQRVDLIILHDDVKEMQQYCRANHLTLHEPTELLPYYHFSCSDNNTISFIVTVRTNDYKIRKTFYKPTND